jgi:hypothetical protein
MEHSEVGQEFDLHRVRKVVEVRANIVNELLEQGWILHDIYISNEYRSVYILLMLDELRCPRCGAPANIEVSEEGDRYRYICAKECH